MGFRAVRDKFKGSFTSAFRRYFVNTIFDSTFVLLGIVVGSALSDNPHVESVLKIMLISSLSLGISTGVSVFEAENLERERRITELEKHLFRTLEGTDIEKTSQARASIIAFVNFLTPLFSFAIITAPFILVIIGLLTLVTAAWISVAVALSELFAVGWFFGRLGRKNPYLQGLRMLAFGLIAFTIGYWLESLL